MLLFFSVFYTETLFSYSIKILDTKILHDKELSGLAYKNKNLYIVANDCKLYTFFIKISNNKISSLELISMNLLKTKKAKVIKTKKCDAEGVSFFEDKLLISFERKNRVELFSTKGIKIKSVDINKALHKKKSYQSKNKGLESVAYSAKYGVVTAPELPLNFESIHTIYGQEKTWEFSAKGGITALEFITQNEILVLLNAKSKFTQRKTSFLYCVDSLQAQHKGYKAKFLMEVYGNFEGLTKLYENFYLMVSDSEDTQKAELVLFELKD